MSEDTGGGAHVGGNASAGGNFTGRDSHTEGNHENNFNFKLGYENYETPEDREGRSPLERIRDMELYLYGDKRVGEPGLIAQTRSRLLWRQIDTALLAVILILVAKMVWS